MMKKKQKEQEEKSKNNSNIPTDNKEDSKNTEANSGEVLENPVTGDTTETTSEKINSIDTAPDKVDGDVSSAEVKLAEMQDRYIRLSAEFDNYRKRTLREKMELSKYAGEDLIIKIIPLMDDFDRALSHMDSTTDCNAMKDGIDLIYGKFFEFLKQNGIKEIESLNCDFNVDLHEAIAKVPVEKEDQKGKVVDVVQKGYYIHDKVLRFSKVVVGE